MVAKLIVHAPTRERALDKMARALRELSIEGIKTNIARQEWIIKHQKFRSGKFDTSYYAEIEKEVERV
jgi:biotin carboxylase